MRDKTGYLALMPPSGVYSSKVPQIDLFLDPTPPDITSDESLIANWLSGRPAATQRSYLSDVVRFQDWIGTKSLAQVSITDLNGFRDSLGDKAPASCRRFISSIRSLLKYGHNAQYLPRYHGGLIQLPRLKDKIAEKILPQLEIQRMLLAETNPRNHVLLLLLYASGIRAKEICDLQWNDLQNFLDGGGKITIFGKGDKTRWIQLQPSVWEKLLSLRPKNLPADVPASGPLFVSRHNKGREVPQLSEAQVWRIVKKAAQRVGINLHISPHWMRHAHGSHAIERGAPLHLVQQTLGHKSLQTTGRYLHSKEQPSSAHFLPV